MTRWAVIGALAVALASPTLGCGSGSEPDTDRPNGRLLASDGRVQLLPGIGAAYLRIVNGTDRDQRLLSAEAAIATSVSIHETETVDGVVRMLARSEGFVIPAGEELVLEPGGKHLMLHGLDVEGDPKRITLTLSFSQHPPIELDSEVIDHRGS